MELSRNETGSPAMEVLNVFAGSVGQQKLNRIRGLVVRSKVEQSPVVVDGVELGDVVGVSPLFKVFLEFHQIRNVVPVVKRGLGRRARQRQV